MDNRYTVIYKFLDESTLVEQYLAPSIGEVADKIFLFLGSPLNGAMLEEERRLINTHLFQFHSKQLLIAVGDLINVWDFSAISSAQIHIIKTALSISDH